MAMECVNEPLKRYCFRCGETGHHSRNCNNEVCYNCFQTGHIAADCREGKRLKLDISELKDGEKIDLIWRKKPIWVVKRTQKMLDSINTNETKHKDPLSENTEQQPNFAQNKFRSIRPEVLVLEGVCTHLGCNPAYNPDENNFFCACHGSKFDMAGKVSNGSPAGANLKVPPYRFENDNTIIVGEMPEKVDIDKV